jgi:hypothetical protein
MQIERDNLQQFGTRKKGRVYRMLKMVGINDGDDGRWVAPFSTGPDVRVELKHDSFSGRNV